MSHATRIAMAVAGMILLIVCGIAGSYGVAEYQVDKSQRQWCDTFGLITETPVSAPSDPSANPSRVQTYRLYEDFVTLKRRFGCN